MGCKIYLADGQCHDIADSDPLPEVGPGGVLIVGGARERVTYAVDAWVKVVDQQVVRGV